jgi:hypothetical protein
MGKKRSTRRVVCTRCLEESDAQWVTPGHSGVEMILYLVTLPLLGVGGLLYTGIRCVFAHWACPVCGSKDVVPVRSIRGRAISEGREETVS